MRFHTPTLAIAALCAIGLEINAHAAESPGQSPAPNYSESLTFSGKIDGLSFHLDHSYDLPNHVMQEWVPQGETGANWSQMITTITFKNHPEVDTSKMIAGTIGNFRSICAKVDILKTEVKVQTDPLRQKAGLPAEYKTYSALVHCDSPDPAKRQGSVSLRKHEVVWFKGIQGFLTAHLVQRAWHGDEIKPDSILASADAQKSWQAWINNVAIAGIPKSKLEQLNGQ